MIRCIRVNAVPIVLAGWAVLVLIFGRTDGLVAGMLLTVAVAAVVQVRELLRLYRRHHWLP